ncbi:MAG TPA: hypothetical protein VIM10_05430 [Actinopolymorphaceae bacterium]|jgi:hypothetical protein
MQARLGLVEHHQLRWSRREHRRHPEQVAQRPAGEFGRAERAQQARLGEREIEVAARVGDREPRAREGLPDGGFEGLLVADLDDPLDRGRQVGAVAGEHGGERADAWSAGRCVGIGADRVVEPPGADALADREQLRRPLRIGELGEHAVAGAQPHPELGPPAVVVARLHLRPDPLDKPGRRPRDRPGKDDLVPDDRVELERGRPFDERRVAEIDLVAELVAGVPELEGCRVLLADRGDAPRTGPECGRHAALARDGADDSAECHVGQQAQ